MKKWFFVGASALSALLLIWLFIPAPGKTQATDRTVDSTPAAQTHPTPAGSVAQNAEEPGVPATDTPPALEDPLAALLAGGPLLESREIAPSAGSGSSVRVEIYRTTFKYPLVRVERNEAGEIVSAAVADHVVVRRRPGVTHESFATFIHESGLEIRKRLYGDSGYLVSGSAKTLDALTDLQTRLRPDAPDSPVEGAEPDSIATICAVPNDPHFSKLYGMNNSRDADIDAPEAWDTVTGSGSVVVGVIDTGIDYNHPDLAVNIWTNLGEIYGNGIDDDGNGLIDDTRGYDFYNDDANPMDDHSHGTHCAGTIGAQGNNGIGVAGVTWSSRMMALKAFSSTGSGPSSAILEAIVYSSEMGARVTSNSYVSLSYSPNRNAAIEAAGEAGCLFVTAAGNEGRAIVAYGEDGFHRYVASANLEHVLSVAATDSSDKLASFSNHSPVVVDIAAPGVGIYSTLPGNQYGSMSGTSMATPHVAGACALLLARDPSLTPLQVKQQVMATVDLIPSLAGKAVTGGRINVRRMLEGLNYDPPAITSPLAVSATFGTPFTYAITATNSPGDYGVAGLPQGLKLNRDTGTITGIPAVTGSFAVELRASNLGGTATATLVLTVALEPPVITSPATAAGAVYATFSHQITATNGVETFASTGLPDGLTLNPATGLISGYPEAEGVFMVGLTATNALGSATQDLAVIIGPPSAPQFLGLTNASAVYAVPFSYSLVATNLPTRFAASGLPAGLSINATTGLISGTPAAAGTFTIGVEAENSAGITSAEFSLLVNLVGAPVLTTPASATAPVNAPFSFQITATNLPESFTVSGLPAGLSLANGGIVSGTPTEPGTFLVELSATNATGTGRGRLSLIILPPPPVITSATSASVIASQPFSYQIAATGAPKSFAVSGLPAGLRLEPGTGRVVGSVASPGVFQFIVSATNAGGTGSAQVALQVLPQPPVITSTLEAYLGMNSPFSYDINASNNPDVFSAANLPSGLSLNTATGRITGTVATTGTYTISISATNAGGTGTANLELVVHNSETRITSFAPVEVLPGGEITISGVGFTGATDVFFSNGSQHFVPPTSYQVVSDDEIRAVVPFLSPDSWIIVISPRGLAVAFPPTSIQVSQGYDLGGSGGKFAVVKEGGALIAGGGGSHRVVIEDGGSARLGGGGNHAYFVDSGGFLDLTGGGGSAVIFRTPTSIILNGTTVESLPDIREVSSVRVTVMNRLLNVLQVPKITSPLVAVANVGELFGFQLQTFSPLDQNVSLALTGPPPPGLTFDAANKRFSGYPETPGVYDLALSATNSIGTTHFILRITVSGMPIPVLTSASRVVGTTGGPLSYQIVAANPPSTFTATGLPPGLQLDSVTGLINGTPTGDGIFPVTLVLTNIHGSSSRVVTFYIGLSPLSISSFTPDRLATGAEVTLNGRGFTEVNQVYFFAGSGLIPDLGRTIQSDTAMKAVVPAQALFNSPVMVTSADYSAIAFPANSSYLATDGPANITQKFAIVEPGADVTLTGGGSNRLYVKSGGSVTTGGSGGQIIFLESGATAYLGGGGGGNLIIRSPSSTVVNQGSTTVISVPRLSLDILSNSTLLTTFILPVITSGDKAAQVGVPLNYATIFQATGGATGYAAAGLPPGLSISASTGVISGTPTTSGAFPVLLTVTTANGAGSKTVTFNVTLPLLPELAGSLRVDGSAGVILSSRLSATNGPVTYAATGLPPGLNLSPDGQLSGTTSNPGVWIANVNLTNPTGTRTVKFTVAIDRPQPVITSMPSITVTGQSLTLGGNNLAHATAVYLKYSSGLGSSASIANATATSVTVTTPSVQPMPSPGMIMYLIAQGGATVTLPTGITEVTAGMHVTASGSSSHYRVRRGGILSGIGGGSLKVYAEAGSLIVLSGGGSHLIFAENGATIDEGSSSATVIAAPNANLPAGGNFTVVPVADLRPSPVSNYINASPIPIITSKATVRGYRGVPFYFIVKAANNPTAFAAIGLPPGLVMNTSNGAISGSPATGGTFVASLTTTNTAGSHNATLTFTIGGPVDQWRETQFSSLPEGPENPLAADDADPDGDLLVNLLEYAGKLDPNVRNSTSDLYKSGIIGGHCHFSFRRLQGAGTGSAVAGYNIDGIEYVVEWSRDLSQWHHGAEHFELVDPAIPNGDGSETVTVRLKKTVTELPGAVIRLRVRSLPTL